MKKQTEKTLSAREEIDNKKIESAVVIQEKVLNDVSDEVKIETVALSEQKVKGIVTDPDGIPLVGASIRYSGTNTGTVSDTNGYFELPEAKEKAIQIDFIGYTPVNLEADTNETMLVAMKENTEMLSEIVVVGYGTQKRNKSVSVVSSVKEENIKPQPVIGKKEYDNYLKENKITPQSEDCKGKKGKVKLKFSIDKKGRPTNISIVKSLCPEADKEAIRLIEQGSDWMVGVEDIEIEVKF
jgi:TonB family protein